MAAIGIKENIEVCPYCGAETIKYDKYSARFSCKKMQEGFFGAQGACRHSEPRGILRNDKV